MVVYRLPLLRCHIPGVTKGVRGVQEVKGEEPGARIQEAGARLNDGRLVKIATVPNATSRELAGCVLSVEAKIKSK
jgi:hypothetical protein